MNVCWIRTSLLKKCEMSFSWNELVRQREIVLFGVIQQTSLAPVKKDVSKFKNLDEQSSVYKAITTLFYLVI